MNCFADTLAPLAAQRRQAVHEPHLIILQTWAADARRARARVPRSMRASSSLTALDSLEHVYSSPIPEPPAPPPNEAQLRARARAEARATSRGRLSGAGASLRAAAPEHAPPAAPPPAAPERTAFANGAGPAESADARREAGSGPGPLPGPSGRLRLSLDGAMQRVSEEEAGCEAAAPAASGAAPARRLPLRPPLDDLGNGGAAPRMDPPPEGAAGCGGPQHADCAEAAGAKDEGSAGTVDVAASAAEPGAADGPKDAGAGVSVAASEPADESDDLGSYSEAQRSMPEAASSAPAELIPSVAELACSPGRAKPV